MGIILEATDPITFDPNFLWHPSRWRGNYPTQKGTDPKTFTKTLGFDWVFQQKNSKNIRNLFLVGGFNPFEKCLSNWMISPGKVENKKYLKRGPFRIRWKYSIFRCLAMHGRRTPFFLGPRGTDWLDTKWMLMDVCFPEKSHSWKEIHSFYHHFWYLGTVSTPPKTNTEPENGGLEDEFPFQTGDFQVPCSFSGVYIKFRWVYGSCRK